MTAPRVAVVVPTWNSGRFLPGCLAALAGQTYPSFRVILVDDASNDSSAIAAASSHDFVEVITLSGRRGFAGAANAGIAACDEDMIALLNVDTRAHPAWLAELVGFLAQAPEGIGAVASKMVLMEDPGRLDDTGNTLSWWGSASKRGHGEPADAYADPVEIFSVCAGAALFRKSFFKTVGVFDPEFESYFEDIDLGFRGRMQGYSYRYVPSAVVEHFGHGSPLGRGRYVQLVTQNRALTFLKCAPASLLLKHAPTLFLGQIYFLIAYRRPLRSAAGYFGVARKLAHAWRERRRIQRSRVCTTEEVDSMLTDSLGEPSLLALARNRLRRA